MAAKQEPKKTEAGVQFPAAAYAHVPDGSKPSTWKLRLFDTPADVAAGKPSIRITAAAVMALSSSGFRGQPVQIPASDRAAVKRKVAAAWLKARRQAGQQAALPQVLKVDEIPATKLEGIVLSLDEAGQEAFSRLAGSLPEIAKVVGDLARDMVVDPTQKRDEPVPVGTAVADLEILLLQVKDEAIKKRIEGVLGVLGKAEKFGISQTDPGTLQPEQGELEPGTVEEPTFAPIDVKIVKIESEEERTVFGIVLEPEEIDSQKDVYSEDEVRKTAYQFLERYQQFGLMHQQIVSTILPLESYLAPVEFKSGEQTIKKGTWLLRTRILDDAIWKKIKKGELTGYSIGGSAVRTPDKVKVTAA